MLSTGFSTDTDESIAVFQTLLASQCSPQFVLIGSRPSRPQLGFPITLSTCYVHTFGEKVVGLVLLFAKKYTYGSEPRPIAGTRIKIMLTICVNAEEAGAKETERRRENQTVFTVPPKIC